MGGRQEFGLYAVVKICMVISPFSLKRQLKLQVDRPDKVCIERKQLLKNIPECLRSQKLCEEKKIVETNQC